MSAVTMLFLPSAAAPGYRWLRLDDGNIIARGEGLPATPEGPVTAIVPAEDVTLHWAELPRRSMPQTLAAARALIAEASAAPIADLHVAVGDEGSDARPVAVVAMTRMQGWLDALGEHGFDPEVMIPAPMLVPRPDAGFVIADLGGERVVRGAACGFADAPELTAAITAEAAPVTLSTAELEAAIVAAVAQPPLNLRQGGFARRERVALDRRRIRRAAWLAVAAVVLALVVPILGIIRYTLATQTLEARADAAARAGLAPGASGVDTTGQLDARLARLRGPGRGFTQTAAIAFDAVRAVPGVEARSIAFDTRGVLKLVLSAPSDAAAREVAQRIEASGLSVAPIIGASTAGRVSAELTVTPQ